MRKTFIIPMAFIAASSVSIGTGLLVNKAIVINNSHVESVVMSDMKTATVGPITAIATNVSTIGTTDGTIVVTSTITSNSDTLENVEVSKDGGTSWETASSGTAEAVSHTFSGLGVGEYEINVKVTFATTGPITKVATTTVAEPVEISNTKIEISEIKDTTVDVKTTWVDGTGTGTRTAPEKVTHIAYVATPQSTTGDEAKEITIDPKPISGELTDITTIEGLAPETNYTVTATLRSGLWSSTADDSVNLRDVSMEFSTLTEYTGLSKGAVTGIIVGSITGVVLLGAGGYWVYTNKNA